MGILREIRSSLENPATPLAYPAEWVLDMLNGGRTDAGIRVSELTALQVSTAYACVDLISGSLAAAPFNVYELLDPRGKKVATDQNSHWILHDEPNPEMTAFTFRKTMQVHALLWTNAYAEIERNAFNQPVALWPMDPYQTRARRATVPMSWRNSGGILVEIKPGDMFYETRMPLSMDDKDGHQSIYRIAKEDIIHIPGLSLDGRVGKPIIELLRAVFGMALAAEKFGGKFFANGLRPSGVVELPPGGDMAPQAIENFKRSLLEAYGGENTHRPLIIEPGMKWTQSSTTPNDAQFLQTREHQRSEIAAIFHVPPHMVGDVKQMTRATAEQVAIEFVQYTLKPWVAPWVQETSRKLFPRRGRTAGKYITGYDLQDLLTPDSESRGKLVGLMRQWGCWTANDARDFSGLNPIAEKWADECWQPVNMGVAGAPPPAQPAAGRPPEDKGDEPAADAEATRYAEAYRAVFTDAFKRISAREKPDSVTIYRIFAPVLGAARDGIAMNAIGFDGLECGPETEDFIKEYCSGLCKQWDKRKSDPEAELQRAVRAVKVAVYRDLATQRAKSEETHE